MDIALVRHLLEESSFAGKSRSLDVIVLERDCVLGKHFHVGETEMV